MPSVKPTVSVVIPTYNRADYLYTAVHSVLDQRLEPGQTLEVIVVDDGSIDDTNQVINRFKDRIRYFNIPHTGLPAKARNFGISKAKSDLIAFQDSDDIWLPDKLQRQLPAFDDPEVVLCYGNGIIMEAEGKPTKNLIVPHSHLKDGYIFADLVKENFISTLTVIVRKSALEKSGYFNEALDVHVPEDYELWLRLSGLKIGRFKSIKKPLAYYRRHDKNVSSDTTRHPLQNILAVMWAVQVSCGDKLGSEYKTAIKKALDNYQSGLAEYSQTSTPLVSVVMSVYNAGPYLKDAIESILNQTYINFEFIIVDDGSKDDSWKKIKSFSDKRIKAYHQNNQGLQAGLNTGISHAEGKYIARMDQDDISLPERLTKQVRFLENNDDIAIVGTNFALIDPKGKTISKSYYLDRPDDIRLEVFLRNPFGHGTVMIRRSVFDEVGNYNKDEPVEDYELWWRILQKFKGSNLVEELYQWRVVPSSMSHSASDERQVPIHKMIKKIWRQSPLPKVTAQQIKSGLAHYSQYSPQYAGQFMYMLSALCISVFKMRRYRYGLSLLLKLLATDPLFRSILRELYLSQNSHEYVIKRIHPR